MTVLSRRFLIETLLAALICVALYTFGWSVAAEAMLHFAATPVKRLVVEDPSALSRTQFYMGLVSAIPPIFAWLADLLFRLRTRTAPSWFRLMVSLAIALMAVGFGFLAQLLFIRSALAAASREPSDLEPLVAISDLSPALSGFRFGLGGGVLVLVL